MKPTEAAALLTIAAAYDNRKPDVDQAKAWAMVLDGLRFEDCRTVVVEHFKRSRDWMMPVDVIAGVKRLRTQRLLEFGPIPAPDHLDPQSPTFDRDYAAYMLAETKAIADGDRKPKPDAAPTAVGPARDVRELGMVRSVDSALAGQSAREALDRARREKQAAEAERKRAEDERRAELERMRLADVEARAAKEDA